MLGDSAQLRASTKVLPPSGYNRPRLAERPERGERSLDAAPGRISRFFFRSARSAIRPTSPYSLAAPLEDADDTPDDRSTRTFGFFSQSPRRDLLVNDRDPDDRPNLERFRSYLLLLARMELEQDERARIVPSDVVQQTLLEAWRGRDRLPQPDEQLAAWLRTALAHNLCDARRNQRRQKRDAARLRSIERQLAESSARLDACWASLGPTPSQQAVRQEELLRLAAALERLPEAQRLAIVGRHLQGLTLAETARRLAKTEPAVAGLLHRGLRHLREMLAEPAEGESHD